MAEKKNCIRMTIWIRKDQKKSLMLEYAKTSTDQTETIRQAIDLYFKSKNKLLNHLEDDYE